MASSSTVNRLGGAALALGAAGCVTAWLWIGELPAATIAVVGGALAAAALVRLGPWRGARAFAELALLAGVAYALHRFYRPDGWRLGKPAGDLHWTRLPPGIGAHALFSLSVLAVLLFLLASFAAPLTRAAARARGWVTPARLVIGAGAAFALWCAADAYCFDRGTGFLMSRARYHPYLAYDIEGSYGYRHATERTVRDTRGIAFDQHKPPGTIRVVLAGASTVWGHALETNESLSRALAAALARAYPGARYEVVTVAFPGKFQLNELIDAAVTLPHWDPDLVISLNGWNEIAYGEDGNSYEGMPYIAPQIDLALGVHPLSAWLYQNTFVGSVAWKRRLARDAVADQVYAADAAPYEPPRYFAYLRSTARNLRDANIPYAYSFCPSVHELAAHTPEPPGGRDFDRVVRERRRAAREIVEREQQLSFDAMDPLRGGSAADLFLDDCHLNARATVLVAEDLARRVPGWLKARAPALAAPPR